MRLAGLIGAAALAAAASTGAPPPAQAQNIEIDLAPGEVLLKVDAEGVHFGRPDVMEMRAGVVTTGRTAREALASNAVLAERLLAAVRAAGVAPRDVQTSTLAVSPQFAGDDDGDDGKRRITGYVARNALEFRLRELGKAGDIVNSLFEAGANEVDGPEFSLSDSKPALRAARQAAVAEARLEADTYAEALGMKVSRVLRVSERQSFEDEGENGQQIVVTGSRVQAAALEPGEIGTRVQVWIDYALVPR
jgi:uncharacterized protein YggE